MNKPTVVTHMPDGLRFDLTQNNQQSKTSVRMLSDAELLARWMNASSGTKSNARIASLRTQLEQFDEQVGLYQTHRDELQNIHHGRKPRTSIKEIASACKQSWNRLTRLHRDLNEALSRYTFNLAVGYTGITDTRRAGLMPKHDKASFGMKYGLEVTAKDAEPVTEWTITEADAAMSLLRLHLTGELYRVHLCDWCHKRWHVAKSHYRFCSEECRFASYENDPHFKEKKARNQKAYRRNLKLKQQREDSLFTRRRKGTT